MERFRGLLSGYVHYGMVWSKLTSVVSPAAATLCAITWGWRRNTALYYFPAHIDAGHGCHRADENIRAIASKESVIDCCIVGSLFTIYRVRRGYILTYERNLIVSPLSAARTALRPVHFNRYLADVSRIEFKARHVR